MNRLNENSFQGDKAYIDFFKKLKKGYSVIDISACPDLGPVMMALAAVKGGAVFTGSARLRLKESDRGVAMARELAKCGIAVTVEENTIIVSEGALQTPTEPFNGHNDHRIVMALSLISSLVGGSIDGAQAVAKSFPDYFDVLRSLGVEVIVE